ncbi:MAG: hypothetical protein HY537_10685 [Deltaproteobacteria bacterium]|nr:hypothetical protein [Deltaproteobacteria bacterium]
MKGLKIIPSHGDLKLGYEKLLHKHPSAPSETELARYSQWSRFDPRLAEICVIYLSNTWEKLNPISLRKALLMEPWPSAQAVLFEFVSQVIATLKKEQLRLFRCWSRTVTLGFAKAFTEQFFIGLRQLGATTMTDDARFSLAEYCKWGYLSREILIPKGRRAQSGRSFSLTHETRQEILKSLLEKSTRITTEDYWKALEHCISRRQAERDLTSNQLLKPKGHTKARYFVKR